MHNKEGRGELLHKVRVIILVVTDGDRSPAYPPFLTTLIPLLHLKHNEYS
jgi:hypothetical protein